MKDILRFTLKSFCLLFALWFTGCQNEQATSTDSQWTEIIIKLDGQIIDILNIENRSGWNRISVPRDTAEPLSFSRSQLDSIYTYVHGVIENHPVSDHFVAAAYAENVSFEIIFSNEVARSTRTTTSKQIEFQYIESWKDLSEDTKGLSSLLAKNVRLLK